MFCIKITWLEACLQYIVAPCSIEYLPNLKVFFSPIITRVFFAIFPWNSCSTFASILHRTAPYFNISEKCQILFASYVCVPSWMWNFSCKSLLDRKETLYYENKFEFRIVYIMDFIRIVKLFLLLQVKSEWDLIRSHLTNFRQGCVNCFIIFPINILKQKEALSWAKQNCKKLPNARI